MEQKKYKKVKSTRQSGKGTDFRKVETAKDSRGQRKTAENRQLKAVAVGCLTAIGLGVVLLCILSMAMAAGKVPIWAVKIIGLVLGCLMAVTAAFCCARYSRQNGFFLGMLCAAVLFAIAFLCSVSIGEYPSMWAFVKLFSMLICGCAFGSVGVNVRTKRQM